MNQQTGKRIYAFLEILAIAGFLVGFFYNIPVLAAIAGVLLIIDDILEMLSGRLKPLFPIVFAIVLGYLIRPWYLGVIWSVVVFKALNIPKDIQIILNPKKHKSIKELEEQL